jgi:hypothetical protein
MFKWIERKILRPIIKNPVESLLAGAAVATMGPAAAGVIGKLSVGTKVALASSAASTAGAILTRNDAKKENTRVLAANKAESERVYEQNKKEVVESREYNEGVRENYYDNLVKDAQKAGINPLTALRAGGGSAYGNAVAGTMAQGVMMDGVYATPTLTRNPIAAGIETGVQVGLEQMNRANYNAHDVRMAKLRGQINRANALSIHKLTTDEIDYTGYDQGDAVPVKFGFQDFTVPLEIAKRLRIAPNDYVELGVIQELFGEASGVIAELAQAGIKHQYGIYGPQLLGSVNDKKYQNKGSQITVNPIEQQGWSNEWRHHVDRALQ